MKIAIFSLLATLLLATNASAILDTNDNAMSDVWERQYNDGELFPPTFLPNGDADADGQSNVKEATAGTDPLSFDPPEGHFVQEIRHIPATWYEDPQEQGPVLVTPEVFEIKWHGLARKEYSLLYSPNLNEGSWIEVDYAVAQQDGPITIAFLAQDNQGMLPDKQFWRVEVRDFDDDGDGLTNHEEQRIGTLAYRGETFGGIPDVWLASYYTTVVGFDRDADDDNDGISNFDEFLHSTNPKAADTDGDQTSDGDEINHASDPRNASDNGQAPSDSYEEVPFTVGGDYASWRMEIRGKGPDDSRIFRLSSTADGPPITKTLKLRRNNHYQITLHRTGGNDGWYCWEAGVDNKPGLATFEQDEEFTLGDRTGEGRIFTVADHWLVDNRDGLLTSHLHSDQTDVATGLKADLVPMVAVVGDAWEIEDAESGFVGAEVTPTPSVEMTVTASSLQSGDLYIELEGTVRDSISRFAASASERPKTLYFYHQDELLHSIPLDETVGDGFQFDETIVIPDAKPEAYVIRAETSPNVAGKTGYDESVASLTWEEDASAFPTLSAPLSIFFASTPDNGSVDQATLFVGSGAPGTGDNASVETAADSLTFTGNLLIPAQPNDLTATCQLRLHYLPTFSVTEVDSIVVRIECTTPGFPKNHFYGKWVESGINTNIFRPSNWVFGNQILKTSQSANGDLRGTQSSEVEACTLRLPGLPASLVNDGLKIIVGGIAYDLINRGDAWYPEDPNDEGEIKRFAPSANVVPARLAATGYDPEDGSMKFYLRYPNEDDIEAGEVLFVPGEEIDEPVPPVAAARIYSLETASEETPAPWQPGGPVIPEHVIWAYRFLNANDDFAIELLDGYLRGGHQIETKDFWFGVELDLDVTLNDLSDDADNIWTIQIEEDINPIHAARLLFEGLKQASVYREVNIHYEFAHENGEWNGWMETEAFRTAMREAVTKTQQTAIAATELYLSGLGIVNEGLDWIIVINDVADGHYESLAGALPFIPVGLVKAEGFLKIRKLSGHVTDELDPAGIEALKQLYRENDLMVMGITMDEFSFSENLRRSLSTSGGPITAPTEHSGLRKAMEELGPKPTGKFTAHHDFPWEFKDRFARRGIDVNNPAFGRWVTEYDHWTWHSGPFGIGGQFHNEWRIFFNNEAVNAANGSVYSYVEIIDKLASIRAQFSVTGGND